MKNNVIGPISPTYWYTLLMYKQSIEFMKNKDPIKYRIALDKELKEYKSLLKDILPNNDNNTLTLRKAA